MVSGSWGRSLPAIYTPVPARMEARTDRILSLVVPAFEKTYMANTRGIIAPPIFMETLFPSGILGIKLPTRIPAMKNRAALSLSRILSNML